MDCKKKMKEFQLEMLKEVLDICDMYCITCFAIGGTLLGAIRHQGFIPWDDDIDLGMKRSDYNKFLEVAPMHLSEHLFLQTRNSDEEFPMCFAKIRNSNTTFIENAVKNHRMNHGVYIDVFPLDGCSNSSIIRTYNLFKMKLLNLRIAKGLYLDSAFNTSMLYKLCMQIAVIFYKDIDVALMNKEKMMIKYDYNKSKYIINYCGAWGIKEMVPKKWFESSEKIKFEYMDINIPNGWHLYLKRLYGEYMVPPPAEKQISHHCCTVIDMGKSYKNYI